MDVPMGDDLTVNGPTVDDLTVDGPTVDGPTVDGPTADGLSANRPIVYGPMAHRKEAARQAAALMGRVLEMAAVPHGGTRAAAGRTADDRRAAPCRVTAHRVAIDDQCGRAADRADLLREAGGAPAAADAPGVADAPGAAGAPGAVDLRGTVDGRGALDVRGWADCRCAVDDRRVEVAPRD
jgi:hypothetical protein